MPIENWLILALGLCIAEILVPGIFLIFVGAGAAVAGIVSLFTNSLGLQLGAFAAGIVAALVMGISFYRNLLSSKIDHGLAKGPIGEPGVVEEEIVNGTGKVRVRDISWLASGPDLHVGTPIVVTGRAGTRLNVRSATSQEE